MDVLLWAAQIYTILGIWFFMVWAVIVYKSNKTRNFAIDELNNSLDAQGHRDGKSLGSKEISQILERVVDNITSARAETKNDVENIAEAELNFVSLFVLRKNLNIPGKDIEKTAEALSKTTIFARPFAFDPIKRRLKERTSGLSMIQRVLIEDMYKKNFNQIAEIVKSKQKTAA